MKRCGKNGSTQIDDDNDNDNDEWYNVVGKLVMDSWCYASGFDDVSTAFELFRFYHILTPTFTYMKSTNESFWNDRKNLLLPCHTGNYFAVFEVNCLCLCACKHLHTHIFRSFCFGTERSTPNGSLWSSNSK